MLGAVRYFQCLTPILFQEGSICGTKSGLDTIGSLVRGREGAAARAAEGRYRMAYWGIVGEEAGNEMACLQ